MAKTTEREASKNATIKASKTQKTVSPDAAPTTQITASIGRPATRAEIKAVRAVHAALEGLLQTATDLNLEAPKIAVAIDTSHQLDNLEWPATGLAWTAATACSALPIEATICLGPDTYSAQDPRLATERPAENTVAAAPAASDLDKTVANAISTLLTPDADTQPPVVLLVLADQRPSQDIQNRTRKAILSVLDAGGHVLWAQSPGSIMRMPTRVHVHFLDPSAGPDGDLLEMCSATVNTYSQRLRKIADDEAAKAAKIADKEAARASRAEAKADHHS